VPELVGAGKATGVDSAVLAMDVALHCVTALGDSLVESVAVAGCQMRSVPSDTACKGWKIRELIQGREENRWRADPHPRSSGALRPQNPR
jgi:hypothetical protein